MEKCMGVYGHAGIKLSLCQANTGTAVFTRVYLVKFKYISNVYILVQLFCKKKSTKRALIYGLRTYTQFTFLYM